MSGTPAIAAHHLVKRYRSVTAVDDLSLTVQEGDVYGFLGPNGSGKSTTIRMLLGLARPTSGTVRIMGRDPHADTPAALEGVGGFVEAPGLYPYLSARDNLRLLGALDSSTDPPVDEVLATVDLTRRADDRVGTYSQGMRQRLAIAAALLRRPQLLILDEPTNGLDPGGMREVRDLVRDLAGRGMTIVLSTHLLGEVEQLCTRAAIIARGRVMAEGTLADLVGPEGRYVLTSTDPAAALRLLRAYPGVDSVKEGEGGVLEIAASPDEIPAIGFSLMREGIGIHALVPHGRTLEDCFLELVEGNATP